jgi:phthalate 4,5-dioxygenase oxygenase subunit
MLTREENELLCRVGPGTPMGEFMREYWIPALRAQALASDGAPVRVRLLGENFVAFRATDGRVGFFDEGCPHRCTSLALARNEDNALTCIFHGWKIDVSGKVVEVPSEPPERRAEFAAKVRVRHYPVREAGDAIWVYLGRRAQPPAFLNFELNVLPPSHRMAFRAVLHSNWLQALETSIDSSHLGIMHSSWLNGRANAGSRLATVNTGPIFEIVPKPYGFREAALRDLFDGTVYTRIREVAAPFYSFIPMDSNMLHTMQCPVPIDDHWCVYWSFRYDPDKPVDPAQAVGMMQGTSGNRDNAHSDLGEFDQMWGQDRKKMKEGHFTGMRALQHEDWAVAESVGAILDRTHEYLGSSDSTLIRFRRMMLAAVRAHKQGAPALGLDRPVDYSQIRAITLRNPKSVDWRQIDPLNPPASLPLT